MFVSVVILFVAWIGRAQAQKTQPGASVPDSADRAGAKASSRIVGPSSHNGSSPFDPPIETDSNFVVDSGAFLDTGCSFRSEGPLIITVPVERVVGDTNADGTLVNSTQLVNNGIVSKFATLSMPAFDVDFDAVLTPPDQPERDHVLFNGHDIGPSGSVTYLTGANNVWKFNQFRIPIEFLRFGKLNGSSPIKGNNEIKIIIDEANIPIGAEDWCTAIDWVSLRFGALAPVVMVHGNNSSGAFFSDFNFIKPFQDQKIPFDNSISMPTESISDHGDRLATLIPAIAKKFGAKHVHLVAHSKGGLDSRYFLVNTIPSNFGVLSLTTLSTPHHGSVGADYVIDAVNANALFSDDTTRTLLAQQTPPDAGTFNLRVSYLENTFNPSNQPFLPQTFTVDSETTSVSYFSFAADANLDDSVSVGNPTIQGNETAGTGHGATVMEQVYRLLGTVASTRLETRTILGSTVYVVRETPTESFQLNDFLVTINSARLPGFTSVPATKANHATIANPDIGNQVIQKIRSAQPVN
jgi:hypothetical protein